MAAYPKPPLIYCINVCQWRLRLVTSCSLCEEVKWSLSPPGASCQQHHQSSCLSETVGGRPIAHLQQQVAIKRAGAILLALLQFGHTPLDPSADPVCPLCKEEPQKIERWLRRYRRLDNARHNIFGRPSPPVPPSLKGFWLAQGPPLGRPLSLKPQQPQKQQQIRSRRA